MFLLDSVRSRVRDQVMARTTLATSFDDYPDLAQQIVNIRRSRSGGRGPWRAVSITEALSVPAIFGAVNLIANVTGSMSMKAMRNEVELPPDQRPRILVRPDPFNIPREFYRPLAYNLASRGEAWIWAAVRDGDGNALSLISVPPAEVSVEEDPNDLRYPIIKWRDKVMRNEDFRQLVYSREPGSLRGVGPLQMCGAAISVAVESQLWAANFFAGGNSALWVKTSIPLSGGDSDDNEDSDTFGESEAERFLSQWMDKDPNTPRITDDTIEDIKELNINPQGAAMLEARAHQNIDVATMFNMDAELLNAAVAGSNLTYQNIGGRFEAFVRMCLRPNYLEVIEQTMSDFLTRSTVARFNTDALTLADIKTRYDVYGVGIDKGIIDVPEARRFEGLAPGDVENAPVPMSAPQAIPSLSLFKARTAEEVRCPGKLVLRGRLQDCGRKLGMFVSPYEVQCPRCKTVAAA